MEAHRKLQEETIATYGEVIALLDEVVGINTHRTALHIKSTELQMLLRKSREDYRGYYRSVASFIAQRACHTAQANALLLRHGFQDQAFELWRTMVNLSEQLESMMGDDQERKAERFLDGAAAEIMFLDERAKKRGSIIGKMFDDSAGEVMAALADGMKLKYGSRILKKDGWKNPKPATTGNDVEEEFKAEINHLYQLASKLQHGTPISTSIGADLEMRPLRDPLAHRSEGIPLQCSLTGSMLHSIVTMFCTTTEETEDDTGWTLMERSASELLEISKFRIA